MNPVLLSDENLQRSCVDAEARREHSDKQLKWMADVQRHLDDVNSTSFANFQTVAFQRSLWSSQAISSFGRGGAIKTDELYTDEVLIALLWKLRDDSLPPAGPERTIYLVNLYKECEAHIRTKLSKFPRLKLYNVFASLLPDEFVTLSFTKSLRELASAMGIDAQAPRIHAVLVHRAILDRIASVIGKVNPPPHPSGVARMTLPWLLLSRLPKQADATTESNPDEIPGEGRLTPMPADRRRRSMLTITGWFATVRSLLEFAREGCAREDFKEHIRSINPRLSPTSINSTLNALIGEWGVLNVDGDRLVLTVRGNSVLDNDSADPEDVSDWLITRILGFDHILYTLRQGPATRAQLQTLLRKVNPGWTTDVMPGRIIDWQYALKLFESNSQGAYILTDDGRIWADRIHWEPECLPPIQDISSEISVESAAEIEALRRPSLADIGKAFPTSAVFQPMLIARLDASLWSNERRHFAVLAGLSGAGKTLLARSYALALWQGHPQPHHGLYTVPVQPGWHDPSSLFGYINPLASDTYVRTGFLDFLLRASSDPSRPYTVVLDEMNLSHPEQYLAPLLSAMETGDEIELHAIDEDVGGVPSHLRYPANLLIIGTVNMDETTHGLSDKILDRAAVLEFWDVNVDAYPGWSGTAMNGTDVTLVKGVLRDLTAALRPVRLHFGWRTIGDILGYIAAAGKNSAIDVRTALDHAVFSKILPKLRGEDSTRLRLAFENAYGVLNTAQLKESAAKLAELREDLRDTGSARFWR